MLRLFPPLRRLSDRRPLLYELVAGLSRLCVFLLSCILFALACTQRLDGADVNVLAVVLRQDAVVTHRWIPLFLWKVAIPFHGWAYGRYMLIPLAALLLIFVCSALYVRDIYHLQRLRDALRYVACSLFSLLYPISRVDSGRLDQYELEDRWQQHNLLKAIGGPGFVNIQPGNAVAFRHWREIYDVQTNRQYFMRPFEMIAAVVSLEDQHGHIEELPAITHDGIRLRLRNIDYRFSVLSDESKCPPRKSWERVKTVPRNQRVPYPFSTAAVQDIAYSFAVTDSGPRPWHAAVQRAISGALGTFISTHELDYLTAPRANGQNPRRELRVELFSPALQRELRKFGAELHWIDMGQFDFDDLGDETQQDPVDATRTRLWAVNWVGEGKKARAYGEAIHLAYQELGRAEAQAEMIRSITDSVRDLQFGTDRAENLRHIFLANTAKILDAFRQNRTKKEPPS